MAKNITVSEKDFEFYFKITLESIKEKVENVMLFDNESLEKLHNSFIYHINRLKDSIEKA